MQKERKEIATRLQIARIVMGYRSRSAFVEKFNLKLSTYNAHEIGRHEIGASYISKYCVALNVSVNWLLLGKGNPVECLTASSRKLRKVEHFKWLTYLAETGKLIFS
jgi:hypothetical protein